MKTTLFLLLLAVTSAATAAPSFRELANGDRVHVQFQSRGCFHNYRYDFHIDGGDALRARSGAGRAVALSPAQRSQLDRLLRFYRERREGFCTSQDTITVAYFSGGRKIASERFTDGTCDTYDMKGVTTFRDIGEKLGLIPR